MSKQTTKKIEPMIFPQDGEYEKYGLSVVTMQRMWDKIQEIIEYINKEETHE